MQAGQLLAHLLMAAGAGDRPVTLLAYSMGARLAFHCLLELCRANAQARCTRGQVCCMTVCLSSGEVRSDFLGLDSSLSSWVCQPASVTQPKIYHTVVKFSRNERRITNLLSACARASWRRWCSWARR